MQVNNSELFNPAGVAAPSAQERPDDGLFDALLREEEARYEKAPPAPERRDDYARDHHAAEKDRHEPEDPYRDTARDDTGRREDPEHRDAEPRAGSDDQSEDPSPDSEHHGHQPDDAQPDGSTDSAADWADASPTVAPGTQEAAAVENGGPAAVQNPTTAGASSATATPEGMASGNGGMTGGNGNASGNGQTGANTAQPPTGQGEDSVASPATPAANPAVAPAASASNAAATDKPPATTGSAEKPTPTPAAAAQAASGQAAVSASQKNGKPAEQPNNALPEDVKVTTVKSDNAGLTSRPSAALGGAAATAALAEEAKPAANRPAADDKKSAKTTPGVNTGLDGQKTQNETTAKTARSLDAGSMAANSNAAKTAGDATAGGTSGTSGGGSTSGSLQAPTTAAPANGMSGSTVQNSSFAEAMNSARNGSAQAPAEQVAVQIQKAAAAGKDQINIKLHPAELGRIDVKLESGSDGVLRAVISAERSETLDLLQRDARGLERALQDAGVKTDSGSLNFNLKGQQFADQERPEGQARGQFAGESGNPSEDPQNLAATPQPAQSYHDGALDIRV